MFSKFMFSRETLYSGQRIPDDSEHIVQPESLLSCYKEIWTKTHLADPQVSREKKTVRKEKERKMVTRSSWPLFKFWTCSALTKSCKKEALFLNLNPYV